ncbi:MAG: hypothetical protein ACRDFB_00105, partial [Rhabdochlamydiaceae bacterium]
IQPIINQQVGALQNQQSLIDPAYQQETKALQKQQGDIQNIFETQKTNEQNQAALQAKGINRNAAIQGESQKASMAAEGYLPSSTQSNEAMTAVNNNTAYNLATLAGKVSSDQANMTAQEAQQVDDIGSQLAALPNQEAQAIAAIGTQIAKVQGQGASEALSYAGTLATLAQTYYFKQAQIAISEGQLGIAQENANSSAQMANATTQLKNIQGQVLTTPPTKTSTSTIQPGGLFNSGILSGIFGLPAKSTKTTSTTSSLGWY